jgi:hypothetical protein
MGKLLFFILSLKDSQAVSARLSGGYPCNRPWKPIGLCDIESLHMFYTICRQMAVRLSTLRAGRPLPLEIFLVLISVRG